MKLLMGVWHLEGVRITLEALHFHSMFLFPVEGVHYSSLLKR